MVSLLAQLVCVYLSVALLYAHAPSLPLVREQWSNWSSDWSDFGQPLCHLASLVLSAQVSFLFHLSSGMWHWIYLWLAFSWHSSSRGEWRSCLLLCWANHTVRIWSVWQTRKGNRTKEMTSLVPQLAQLTNSMMPWLLLQWLWCAEEGKSCQNSSSTNLIGPVQGQVWCTKLSALFVIILLLLRSGDVETNSGPVDRGRWLCLIDS